MWMLAAVSAFIFPSAVSCPLEMIPRLTEISYANQDLNAVMDWVEANIKAEIFTS